jgi:hypothetical protein
MFLLYLNFLQDSKLFHYNSSVVFTARSSCSTKAENAEVCVPAPNAAYLAVPKFPPAVQLDPLYSSVAVVSTPKM